MSGAGPPTDRLIEFRRVYAEMTCAVAQANDPRIVQAFATVPRERYLGPGPWSVRTRDGYVATPSDDPAVLYQNYLVAIDAGRELNNGEPAFLARLISLLDLRPGDRAVHVGTGVGYYTAIIAEVVGPTGHVIGFEIDEALARRSKDNLACYDNVEILVGNGASLALSGVDALFVNAGATHPLAVWLDALAPGGRLLVPLTADVGGVAMKITNRGDGYAAECVANIYIYPCDGAREPQAARNLARALKRRGYRTVRTLRRDRHRRGPTCWLHGRGWCFSAEDGALPH